MTWKEFIFYILGLFSADCVAGFLLYILWKYLDLKYFSTFEIETLKHENEYLKHENQKINGVTSNFWSDEIDD